ncbi:MAG: response regulator [Solirubrobacterales bacterium]
MNRVLLVEDDPTIREMTRMTLERDGFAVETAGDGQAGIDAFDRGAGRRAAAPPGSGARTAS